LRKRCEGGEGASFIKNQREPARAYGRAQDFLVGGTPRLRRDKNDFKRPGYVPRKRGIWHGGNILLGGGDKKKKSKWGSRSSGKRTFGGVFVWNAKTAGQ